MFYGATLTGANLSGADARGASFYNATLPDAITNNLIQSHGHVAGLDLSVGELLVVRDYDGNPASSPPTGPLPIVVEQQLAMDASGTLRQLFDADAWDATISFAAGIPVIRSGTLELSFSPNVDPASQIGRTIDLCDWSGVTPTGAFTVESHSTWDISKLYTTGEVTLTATSSSPGDYDGNGIVDAADYTVWRDKFGTNFNLAGNGNENGTSARIVDMGDYSLWKSNFGAPGSVSASTAAPEPSTMVLLMIAVVGWCLRRRWAT